MTPNRRLDQLEPLMAESLQKIDRLAEGQGKILDIAVRADQNAETAARGVANLTVDAQQNFADVRNDIAQLDKKIDRSINELRNEMNQRFDQILDLLRRR